ncbi:MAG: DUF4406 domain-containing protein [Pseudomonadota bacterium]|nr:DUF4406 domain-containing protein [Pseudomonadota bacterium]
MTIIYIAGPITGMPAGNKPAFDAMAKHLFAKGHAVMNPQSLPPGMSEDAYMDICLAMVRHAEAIVLLKGWQQSDGAQAELAYARKRGITVMDLSDDTDHVTKLAANDSEAARGAA